MKNIEIAQRVVKRRDVLEMVQLLVKFVLFVPAIYVFSLCIYHEYKKDPSFILRPFNKLKTAYYGK